MLCMSHVISENIRMAVSCILITPELMSAKTVHAIVSNEQTPDRQTPAYITSLIGASCWVCTPWVHSHLACPALPNNTPSTPESGSERRQKCFDADRQS